MQGNGHYGAQMAGKPRMGRWLAHRFRTGQVVFGNVRLPELKAQCTVRLGW